MAKQRRPITQLVLLGLLLVVLPLGSYLYLEWGFDYRVAALDELEEFGPIATAVDYEVAGPPTVDVIYVVPERSDDSVAHSIANLHHTWDDQPLVQFVGIGTDGPTVIGDAKQAQRIPRTAENLARFAELAERDPHCTRVPVAQRAVVVDTAGTVRRCYDLHVGREVNRLVEHLTMLVPLPEKQDMILEREQEY